MGLKILKNKVILVSHSLNIYYLIYLVAIKKVGIPLSARLLWKLCLYHVLTTQYYCVKGPLYR